MQIYRDILDKIIDTAIKDYDKREAEKAKAKVREEVQK